MKKAVVIGVNGFLGRNLATTPLSKSFRVVGVVHNNGRHVPKGCEIVSYKQIGKIRGPIHSVFFAAGNHRQSFAELFDTHCLFLEKAVKIFEKSVFVYTSSTAVYGLPKGIIKEESVFDNPDMYGLAKLSGEFVVRSHPNYRIVRLTSLYGRGMNEDLFISAIIRMARGSKKITLRGTGTRLQNYLHVHDASELLVQAANAVKPAVLLGSGKWSYSNRRAATMVAGMVPGTKIETKGTDSAPSFRMDNSFTRWFLSWDQKIQFRQGLEEMVYNN